MVGGGGFYERLIQIIKLCLKKNLHTVKLNLDEINTMIIQIEAVLNSRPLTYLHSDKLEQPLTLAHLLNGWRVIMLPEYIELEDTDFNDTADTFRKRDRYLSRLLQHYWRRWKSEYLVDLREHHKMNKAKSTVPVIKEGDIVTVEDENRRNRKCWRLGKIESVLHGRDDVTRGAKVRLGNGNVRNYTLWKSQRRK